MRYHYATDACELPQNLCLCAFVPRTQIGIECIELWSRHKSRNINLGGLPRFIIPSSSALPSCSLANIPLRPLATTVLRKRAASIRRSSLRRQAVRRLPLQPLRLRTPLARLRLYPCVPYARSRSPLTFFRQDCFAPSRDGASSHTTLFPSAVSETVEASPPPASAANPLSVAASGPVSLLPVRHLRTLPF